MQKIVLPDEDGEVEAVPTSERGGRLDPELERLSEIIREFNDLFGVSDWDDHDRVGRLITESMPSKVAANKAFRNARRNSDKQNARIEHERVLVQVMTGVMKDDTKLFKEFMDNEGFRRWMSDKMFSIAYKKAGHILKQQKTGKVGWKHRLNRATVVQRLSSRSALTLKNHDVQWLRVRRPEALRIVHRSVGGQRSSSVR